MTQEQLVIQCIIDYLKLIKSCDALIAELEEEYERLNKIFYYLTDKLDTNNNDLLKVLNIKEK